MPDPSRQKIGRYEVLGTLGQGGFGRVYKAFDPTVNRLVALKVLTAPGSPDLLARFRNEATAGGNLVHPNIVTIYEFDVHDGSPFIAMEYLEGPDLSEVLAAGKPLSLLDKVRIMMQVGRALQFAHEHGVIHRDVKPANIKVQSNGDAKMMDFGIALLAREDVTRLTQTGNVIGTTRYMAPEQFTGFDVDRRSDIFAYGVIGYELIAGRHPFEARDPAAFMYKIIEGSPMPLGEVAPGCPAALDQIVMRALAKDRDVRYQSFEDLLMDLQPLLAELQRDRAAEALARARELVEAGQMADAHSLIREVLELDSSNSEARELHRQIQQEVQKDHEQRAAAQLPSDGKTELDRQNPPVKEPGGLPPAPADSTVLLDRLLTEPSPVPAAGGASDVGPPPNLTGFFDIGGASRPWANAHLTILSCPDSFREGQTIPILTLPFSIGRSGKDLSIEADSTLSREHASISWSGAGFCIRDLGSANGTYIGGRRLPSQQDQLLPLNADILLSKTTRLRFRCDISELPDFSGQKLVDRYTLQKCLRAGRIAALYQALDSRPQRTVAVKVLSPSLASYPGYLEQFQREARIAAGLSHPNICKIYEHGRAPLVFGPGETKETNYICMQMLDGGDLSDRLDATEHTTAAAVAGWLDVVAGALDDAHRNGIMHAGLKPTSIVFSAAGTPYVTDFAIAIRPDEDERSQPFLGAADYLAPEQWDGLKATPESDQYSLAALCYRALTGNVPFEEQNNPFRRARNFEEGPVPADVQAKRHGRPEMPPSLSGVLARALSVHSSDRFPSIREFASAFRRALAQEVPSEHKPKVFLSYRRDPDAGWAAFFADKLAARHGFEVFVDRQRVDSATQVPEKIENAIRQCDFFVCLLAKPTLKSAWVLEEIRIACAAGKPMIPVIQEGFKRPATSYPDHVKRLMNAEEVRLFADYDDSAVEKLAKMMRSRCRKD